MGLVNNLLDAPLMMTFLLYFSPSTMFSRLKFLIIVFVVFEAIILTVFGLMWGNYHHSWSRIGTYYHFMCTGIYSPDQDRYH